MSWLDEITAIQAWFAESTIRANKLSSRLRNGEEEESMSIRVIDVTRRGTFKVLVLRCPCGNQYRYRTDTDAITKCQVCKAEWKIDENGRECD